MKIKFLFLFLFIGKLSFTQLPTYRVVYSYIKSLPYPANSDTNHSNNDEISIEAKIDVIANNSYALVTNTILKIHSPLLQDEIEQMTFKDSTEVYLVVYSTKTVYFINDNKAFTYLSDVFDTSTSTVKIGKYTCSLYYEKLDETFRDKYNIWTSKMIPWYVSPGLFYSRDIGGIVKLDNTETVIELKEIDKTEFDFKSLLNGIKNIKRINTTESRLGSL